MIYLCILYYGFFDQHNSVSCQSRFCFEIVLDYPILISLSSVFSAIIIRILKNLKLYFTSTVIRYSNAVYTWLAAKEGWRNMLWGFSSRLVLEHRCICGSVYYFPRSFYVFLGPVLGVSRSFSAGFPGCSLYFSVSIFLNHSHFMFWILILPHLIYF